MKKIGKIIFWIVIIGIIAYVICSLRSSAKIRENNAILRNIGTDEIVVGYSNVYADVVSFDPRYIVEESKYEHDRQVGSTQEISVICSCKTVEGTTFWLIIPTWAYTGTIESCGEDLTAGYDAQYFDKPIRVHGFMTTFDRAVDNAPEHLKDVLILSVGGDLRSIEIPD